MQMDADAVRQLLDQLDEGVYFVDTNRRITWWSKGAQRLTGYTAQEMIGTTCSDGLILPVNECGQCACRRSGQCPLDPHACHDLAQTTFTFTHRQGHQFPARVRAAPLHDGLGTPIGAIHTFALASEPAGDEARVHALEKMAYVDDLTGIANRRFLQETLRAQFAPMRIDKFRFGLIMIDVDHFKQINDRHGHDVGDDVLRTVAQTLTEATRPADTLGRWGGEEFLIIASTDTTKGLTNIAERARELVEQRRFMADSQRLDVTISVGATLARPGDDLQRIIKRVDGVLYASKRAGRNQVKLAA